MKKNTSGGIAPIFVLVALVLGGWSMIDYRSSHRPSYEQQSAVAPQKAQLPITTVAIAPAKTVAEPRYDSVGAVGKENFALIAKFIRTHGFDAGENDRQYTYFDGAGNRHAMIALADDGNSGQISVWGYKDGIKDQEHFFGYYINEDQYGPFLFGKKEIETSGYLMTMGYEGILTLAKKEAGK